MWFWVCLKMCYFNSIRKLMIYHQISSNFAVPIFRQAQNVAYPFSGTKSASLAVLLPFSGKSFVRTSMETGNQARTWSPLSSCFQRVAWPRYVYPLGMRDVQHIISLPPNRSQSLGFRSLMSKKCPAIVAQEHMPAKSFPQCISPTHITYVTLSWKAEIM